MGEERGHLREKRGRNGPELSGGEDRCSERKKTRHAGAERKDPQSGKKKKPMITGRKGE